MAPYREDELGALVAEHRWALSGPLVVIGLGMLLAPVPVLFLPMGEDWSVMAYLGAAGLFVAMPVAGIAILVDSYRLRGNFVRLHETGLVHRWRGDETSVRYRDVRSIASRIEQKITNGVPGPVTQVHTVTLASGATLSITHGYEDIDGLVAALRARTSRVILDRARAVIEAGDSSGFGALSLSRNGVERGGRALPASELERAEITKGFVKIHAIGARKPWATVPYAEVADAEIFVELVSEIARSS